MTTRPDAAIGAAWTERARKLVAYHAEALDFVRRAALQGLPASPHDARAVAMLWLEAESLDQMVCSNLARLNADVLASSGALDSTRGASERELAPHGQRLVYECAWTLAWEQSQIAVTLRVEPRACAFEAQVTASRDAESIALGFPVRQRKLRRALTDALLAEVAFGAAPPVPPADTGPASTPGHRDQ